MDNTFIKRNYKDLTGQIYHGITFIEYQFAKNSCDFWLCRCHCGELFTARSYDIVRGHTKSCGCLRRETTRKTGLSNRGRNIRQLSKYGYWRVFYRGKNYYCIVNNTPEMIALLNQGYISRQMRFNSDKADPICTIDGNYIKLSRLIAKTPAGLETDHIDHEPENCLICNLRNGTSLQNQANTVKGVGKVTKLKEGKFGISFPSELDIDTSSLIFESKEEANKKRREIEIEKFGDWTYEESQKIAEKFNICEFTFDPYIDAWANTGTLGEIMQLPPDNVLNARLRDLKEAVKRGDIYPDEEWRLQHDLIYDFTM